MCGDRVGQELYSLVQGQANKHTSDNGGSNGSFLSWSLKCEYICQFN